MSATPDDSTAHVDAGAPQSTSAPAAVSPIPRPPLPSQFARLSRAPRPGAVAIADPELDAVGTSPADADRLLPDPHDPAVADTVAAEPPGTSGGPGTAQAPTGEAVAGQAAGREAADLGLDAAPEAGSGTGDGSAVDEPQAAAGEAGQTTDPWGRVDEDGTVYVRTADGERAVGSWQVGEPAQALDYYRRKYDALVVEVELLERRVRSGALPADEANTAMRRTRENVATAQVVGDLSSLSARLDRLQALIEARRARRKAERAKAAEAAHGAKEKLVTEAEALGESADWHDGADRLREMLDQWKALPRLDKPTDDELWHRFSAARTTYTRRRKAHFAEQADKRDDAKATKERLVVEAEALSTSTEWGSTAAQYRALMAQWKAAGPAPRKEEETLWRRFRAAQDVFFAARSATLSERDSAEKEALQVKEQLLVEAEALMPVKDLAAAKAALRSIEERWSEAGRVPRDAMTRIEARLRKVEETIRAGEQAEWSRTSPEALARAEATVGQLRTSVEKLEKQATSAEAAGDERKAADARTALETRRSWLVEAEKTLADFRR